MVEQQYYTRKYMGGLDERKGYEYIAKSAGIKEDFMSKYLLPICNDDRCIAFTNIEELDTNQYPSKMVILPTLTGELIVGQACYVEQGIRGLDDTLFMHNYILSANEKRRYIKDPEKLFGITRFDKSHDFAKGRELPTLAAIPYEMKPLFENRTALFKTLGIDEELFAKLLYAVFKVVNSERKIFIVLDVPTEKLDEYAKALLYHIYQHLPWNIAEVLGVSTYSSKLEANKNVHISFLNKTDMYPKGQIKKAFIFDFINRRFQGIEGIDKAEAYFGVAEAFSHIRPRWEKFNSYAEQLLMALKEEGIPTFEFYNHIAILFGMSHCEYSYRRFPLVQAKIRAGLLSSLVNYLGLSIGDEFRRELMRLTDYAITNLRNAFSEGVLLEEDEIKALLIFKLGLQLATKENIEGLVKLLLEDLELACCKNDFNHIRMLIEVVNKEEVCTRLFEYLYCKPMLKEKVVYTYLEDRFNVVHTLDDLMKQVDKCGCLEASLLSDEYYKELVSKRLAIILESEEDMVQMLKKIAFWCKSHKASWYDELLIQCEAYCLKNINLEQLEFEDVLCNLEFSHTYEDENYRAITLYQRLKTDFSAMKINNIEVNFKVQRLIQIYHQEHVRKEDFYLFIYAFLEREKVNDEEDSWHLNLRKVLDYLSKISFSTLFDFIIWSKGQEVYIDKNSFEETIISFFKGLKEQEGKWPKELAQQKLGKNPKTQGLYSNLNKKLQPTIVRFLKGNGWITKGVVGVIVCAGLGIGMIFYMLPI